jgi:hypothetical protein
VVIFHRVPTAWAFGCLLICASAAADDVDPDNDGSQYAWASNLGWLNAEPLGEGGPGLSLSDEAATGWLWSANSGWVSLSCENTSSCPSVDYGVVNDGDGRLSGYAWSPNLGWISFSCVDSDSCGSVDYGVQVDPASGEMSGWAWAANAGWVSFSCSNSESCANVDYGIKLVAAEVLDQIFGDRFE